jgi:hypothetical protein
MNDDRAVQCQAVLAATLGPPGRMITPSKSAYRDSHPDHLVVFNANICLTGAKVWHGDLDLTADEPALLDLAARTGAIADVLYEHDARFRSETNPRIERAVYSVTPTGHTRVDVSRVERRADGRVYERPVPRPPRWRWPQSPRLWRFWRVAASCERSGTVEGTETSWCLRVGDGGAHRRSPSLVLALHLWTRTARRVSLQCAWYPSSHRAWTPAMHRRVKWHRGRFRPYVSLRLAPGTAYELGAGFIVGPVDFIWG